jgi:divalent metal cation (Fe/Co/Zn/Cd) transporter
LQTDTYSTLGIIAGLVLIYFTKTWWVDSAVAMLFAFIIMFTGYRIVRTSIAGIMDEADETLIKKLVATLNANRSINWIDLHNLRIIQYGSTLHVDCHLTVPWYLNVHEAHREIDSFSKIVEKEFGESFELFVHSDGCLDFSCFICNKQDCTVRKHAFEKKIDWTVGNVSSNIKHQL